MRPLRASTNEEDEPVSARESGLRTWDVYLCAIHGLIESVDRYGGTDEGPFCPVSTGHDDTCGLAVERSLTVREVVDA